MSRPDPAFISYPAKAMAATKARDPRLDAFRGLALVMILIDHMPGNPYEHVTYRNIGFSDAAEAFFVLSGIAAGLAYSGRFLPEQRARSGLWAAVAPMWKRAWTLYLVHLMLTLWVIAIFAGAADVFGDPAYLRMHNLRGVFTNPSEVIFGIVTLGHQIGYVNILPVYSLLLLFAPLAMLGACRHPWTTLAVSATVWFIAGNWRINLPNYPEGGVWFFDPMSWQLIFVVGLVTGVGMRRGKRLVPVRRDLFALAAGWLLLVLAWRMIPPLAEALNHGMWRIGEAGVPSLFVAQNKTILGLPRLLHVLAMLYVLSCLPVVRRLSGQGWASPLRLMGRHGLLVFGLSVVLALFGQTLMRSSGGAAWAVWGLVPLFVCIMWFGAWLANLNRRPTAGSDVAAAARPEVSVVDRR